jgi:hypothetical protein
MARSGRPPHPGDYTQKQLVTFFRTLATTGSVSLAARRAKASRNGLYKRLARDERFARRWDQALQMGLERVNDEAMLRAIEGEEREVRRKGRKIGAVRHYDSRLMMFLLRAHDPKTFGRG